MAKHQLRGDTLIAAIKGGIRQLAKQNENYIYNASELAKFIGTSRPTLSKYSDIIDQEIKKLKIEKRVLNVNGEALIEQFRLKIEKKEKQIENLEKEIDSLRQHHIDIYQRLYNNSYNISELVKPIIQNESIGKGSCILCNSKIDKNSFKSSSNIIKLKPKDNQN